MLSIVSQTKGRKLNLSLDLKIVTGIASILPKHRHRDAMCAARLLSVHVRALSHAVCVDPLRALADCSSTRSSSKCV